MVTGFQVSSGSRLLVLSEAERASQLSSPIEQHGTVATPVRLVPVTLRLLRARMR